METELTKAIKRRLACWRPDMPSSMRTIRYGFEVWTPTGIVDVIRFEDCIESYGEKYACTFDKCVKGEKREHSAENCKDCMFNRRVKTAKLDIMTTCFEVKISVSDFKSPNGHNFHGNRNYYAVPNDIAAKVCPLVPNKIGLIAYYPESGKMIIKKHCKHQDISDELRSRLLYDTLKKWVNGFTPKEDANAKTE